MLLFEVLGNLGRDASVEISDGRKFVKFTVASTETYKDSNGNKVENTTWVSCTMPGDGGNLLPYLVKGATIVAIGYGSVRAYSSAKDRCMKAGCNLSIIHIELVSTNVDTVPRMLFDEQGIGHPVTKCYYVAPSDQKKPKWPATMRSEKGTIFDISNGFALPQKKDDNQQVSNDSSQQPG